MFWDAGHGAPAAGFASGPRNQSPMETITCVDEVAPKIVSRYFTLL